MAAGRRDGSDLLLDVRVQPRAAQSAIAGRHGAVQATCLRRSLLLLGLLRRRGLRPVLQLGVAGRSGPFQAHAWVELDGERLLPGDAEHRPFSRPGPG